MSIKDNIPTFSIKELFENGDVYSIPIYQRNYAWGEGQVNQLVQDVFDFAFDSKKSKNNYYIGTLVVNKRQKDNKIFYDTIDGQQRLTTLNLLIAALHNTFSDKIKDVIDYDLNLTFYSRKKSTETLEQICNSDFNGSYLLNKEYNSNIQDRYRDIVKTLNSILDEDETVRVFYKYLTEQVKVVRVAVPAETDLNHYFEIMNNRGEQLEKHEILKANMLEVLKDDEDLSNAFNNIWEACSDMERYVQYGFSSDERNAIFGKHIWNDFKCKSLEEIAQHLKLNQVNKNENKQLSIKAITECNFDFSLNENHDKDAPERFNSVVNFQNFLLHVLKIQTRAEDASSKIKNIGGVSLDDKRLLDFFKPYYDKSNPDREKFVAEFGFNLLKMKHLFDQFILKREFKGDKEDWSLKRMKWYKDNRVNYVNSFGSEEEDSQLNQEIIMLLSMFHVSAPTMVYKHWLNAALFYLFNQSENIDAENYRDYLKEIAEAFLFGRYIAKGKVLTDYYDIIYNRETVKINKEDLDLSKLDKGTSVENFIFNYLDYILWRDIEGFSSFNFTFKSSIEHHYPQTPPDNHIVLEDKYLHSFGNLSIMSSSKNSRFTNNMPQAKQKNFNIDRTSDSIKMQIMFKITEEDWQENQIVEHGKKMINTLLRGSYA
ncbi:DUF262 domain-containing protein [Yeosuana marina]|uniref:DUF262 domain-containing protein n=1 Tax=Yeosuana marina TaxID=1565536 RepID=UPI0030EC33E0|tara:strand:+ start:2182 stop:4146 length:1965 start_codon:yes stop_codon:yes gene_type:complete